MLTYCLVWGDKWTGNKITAQRISVIIPFKFKWVFCVSSLCKCNWFHTFFLFVSFFQNKEGDTHTLDTLGLIFFTVFFWMRTWQNEIKRGVNLSFQWCTEENKERPEERYRGEPLFLLSDSDIDTNRHQIDDVMSPKLDLAVTMVMSGGTTLPVVTEVH